MSGITIDLGARPDGIMPQGMELLALLALPSFKAFADCAQTFYNGEFDPGSG